MSDVNNQLDFLIDDEGRVIRDVAKDGPFHLTITKDVPKPTLLDRLVDGATRKGGPLDKLFGISGERYQTWPERMVRSGAALAGDVLGGEQKLPSELGIPGSIPFDTPEGQEALGRVQDMTGLMLGGGIEGTPKGALGTAGSKVPIAAAEHAPVFYSAAERAIEAAPQNTMTADQWAGYLRNQPGVKAEELSWLGLDALPKGQVTKQDLLDHAGGHGVKLKEVEKKDTGEGRIEYDHHDYDSALDAVEPPFMEDFANSPEGRAAIEKDGGTAESHFIDAYERYMENGGSDRLDELVHDWVVNNRDPISGSSESTKYSDYQLPGGDNYREMLLQAPLPTWYYKGRLDAPSYEASKQLYHSSHWDEPNVLMHLRMNDRNIPDVGKSLHLEELQSDWHQQGRKQGYKQEFTKDNVKERKGPAGDTQYYINLPENNGGRTLYQDTPEDAIRAANRAVNNGQAVPDAPFKSTWADLGLKRAIAKAAREGYDAISWTPGEQQAARYDLSKQVDTLQYDPKERMLVMHEKGGHQRILRHDGVPPEKLPDFIGKEAADRLLNSKLIKNGRMFGGNDFHQLSGEQLRVGGEGMKAFYDKMLVDKANAIAKKFGGKVEWKELPGQSSKYEAVPVSGSDDSYVVVVHGINGGTSAIVPTELNGRVGPVDRITAEAKAKSLQPPSFSVPVLRLTPAMRDAAVGRGFPLFARGLPFTLTPVDHDPFDDPMAKYYEDADRVTKELRK